jgi:cardiolipin synthase
MPRSRRRRVLLAVALLAVAAGIGLALQPEAPEHDAVPRLAPGSPAFARTHEAHLGRPIVGGNRVDLLLNGEEILPAKLAAIRGARTFLLHAEYFWAESAAGTEIAAALAERCRAGVRVHVLLDGFGTLGMPRADRETLERAGCHLAVFRPLARFSLRRHNNRNHRRILVADGRVGLTGGSGVSPKWTGDGRHEGQWRETDVRIEGPAVAWLEAAFLESWREATREVLPAATPAAPTPPPGQSPVQVVVSSPAGGSPAAYTMVLLAIEGARRSILVTNPYFVPDERMAEALIAARGRGVRVAVLTPGQIDHEVVRSASRAGYGPLLAAGIEIHEYGAALLHAKTMVVDEVWATVGSTNLDNRSFALNDELNVAVLDAAVARRLAAVFEDDLRHARRVELDAWSRRGWRERLLEVAVLPFRDLL